MGGEGSNIHHKTVGTTQECAKLAADTEGANVWVFNISGNSCFVKERHKEKQRWGRITGNRACGQLPQKQLDRMLLNKCKREPNVAIHKYNDGKHTLNEREVANPQACAKLAVETPDGFFWTFNEEQGGTKR